MGNYVKFCGLTRPQDIEAAIGLGAHALGFIIACESPRALSVPAAAKLALPAHGLAKRVAVTVNATNSVLDQISLHMRPDYIQMHGDETPERMQRVKSTINIPLIKAISVRTKADLKMAYRYTDVADYILLDAKPPKSSTQRGGHGVQFNWGILDGFTLPIPYILAGGLSPENIATATHNTHAEIFDVSSGVEASAGVKDHALMADLIKAAHR